MTQPLSNPAIQQAVNAVIAKAAADPQFTAQLLGNPLGTLQASGVPLPPPPDGPDGQPLTDQYNASFADLLTAAVGKKRSWSGAWNGTPDSVACWSCVIGVNAVIWGAITVATVAAVIATDGAVLAPILSQAEITSLVGAATTRALIGNTVEAIASKSPFSVAMVGTFVNMLANMICNAIPNCCSSEPAPDNGIWISESRLPDKTQISPSVAVTAAGSNQTLLMTHQDGRASTLNLWKHTWLYGSNRDKGWGDMQQVVDPTTHRPFLTSVAPAAAAVGGLLLILFVDADVQSPTNGSLVSIMSNDYGNHWSDPSVVTGMPVPNSPTVAVVGTQLYCTYRDSGGAVWLIEGSMSSAAVLTWSAPYQITFPAGGTGPAAPIATVDPGLGAFNGTLYCGYTTDQGNGLRYVTRASNSTVWSSEVWLPEQIIASRPAFAQLGSQFMYLATNPGDKHLVYATTTDGSSWSPQFRESTHSSSQAPALVAAGPSWYAFYKGAVQTQIYWAVTKTA